MSSPTVRRRRLPKSSYSSSSAAVGARGIEIASSAKSFNSRSSPSGGGGQTRRVLDRAQPLDQGEDVRRRQQVGALGDVDAQPLVELVAADLGQVVALGI